MFQTILALFLAGTTAPTPPTTASIYEQFMEALDLAAETQSTRICILGVCGGCSNSQYGTYCDITIGNTTCDGWCTPSGCSGSCVDHG